MTRWCLRSDGVPDSRLQVSSELWGAMVAPYTGGPMYDPNFDIVLDHFLTRVLALYHPTRAVCYSMPYFVSMRVGCGFGACNLDLLLCSNSNSISLLLLSPPFFLADRDVNTASSALPRAYACMHLALNIRCPRWSLCFVNTIHTCHSIPALAHLNSTTQPTN